MSALSDLLREHEALLMQQWLAFLQKDASFRDCAESALRERVRALVQSLCVALLQNEPATTSTVVSYRSARHVRALVREYEVLRTLVLDLAERAGITPTLGEVRILMDFFGQAIADGLDAYHARHELDEQAHEDEAVAQRKALSGELRAREAQLQLVTNALPFLVSFVTADERYAFVNQAYEGWFGQPSSYFVGKSLKEVVGDKAYGQLSPFVKRVLAGESFSFEQYGVPYRTGGERDVRVTFVAQYGDDNRVSGYVALLEDISDRRRLARDRERFARQRTEVLESMGDAFFSIDAKWRILLVNNIYEKIAGKSRDALIGRRFWEVLPAETDPTSARFEHYRKCMTERVRVTFVEHDLEADRFWDVRVYPTADGGIAAFFRDVSVEKRAEAMLRHQSEFEQQLIGIVSHDLRNPLNVIVLSSARLARAEELSEGALKHSVRIQNAAERATNLVKDLLDFTKARLGGGIQLERRAADLHQIVTSVVDELDASYPERSIEVKQEGAGSGQWDPERLAQVVHNLLTNALKYSPPDSVVRVVSSGESLTVRLRVQNDGAPIPAHQLATLFEPFQRATSRVDKTSRSVGLGLYIVREIVGAHGGTVEVTSDAREGTSFSVVLPTMADGRSTRT